MLEEPQMALASAIFITWFIFYVSLEYHFISNQTGDHFISALLKIALQGLKNRVFVQT